MKIGKYCHNGKNLSYHSHHSAMRLEGKLMYVENMHSRSTAELNRCRRATGTKRICQQLINRNSNRDDTHWVWVNLQNNIRQRTTH